MVSSLKLSLGSRCVQYLLFVFNLLFVITGIALLSIGIAIYGVYNNYQHFLDNKFLSAPSLLIAIGAIIFLIAFFGCCGAARENYCMIITFTSLLAVVFILELSAGISGYVLRARASSIIQEKMKDTMPLYKNNTEVAFVWDELQHEFHCCGTINAEEWVKSLNEDNLPQSCCGVPVGSIEGTNCTTSSPNLRHDGCYLKFLSSIKANAVQLGGVGIGIACVQAIGIWFSVYLARSIKNTYESV